jgi:hypothetical protein
MAIGVKIFLVVRKQKSQQLISDINKNSSLIVFDQNVSLSVAGSKQN